MKLLSLWELLQQLKVLINQDFLVELTVINFHHHFFIAKCIDGVLLIILISLGLILRGILRSLLNTIASAFVENREMGTRGITPNSSVNSQHSQYPMPQPLLSTPYSYSLLLTSTPLIIIDCTATFF
ncbi:hypothetical protein PQG02_31005 (plasmid) [Nostoc sp. UHCC 0926]|nr:hypothetical protein PQG02_31005 [Nostoc sp. UHCC 0926]